MRTIILCLVLPVLLLGACQKKEPYPLGFVAGLSGRVADLGVAGRNGAQLAVEERNAAGGIKGRQVALVIRDDEQRPETARKVADELIAQNIELIIGPMTSSMAMAMLPQINASQSLLLSPTVTATDLTGKDDNFLRVVSDTSVYAVKSARYQFEKLGLRTFSVIYDADNAAYTESWAKDFQRTISNLGGKILQVRSFRSGPNTVFLPLVKELLATGADSLLIISNAVDSALICQQIHKLAAGQIVAMSEWASTERFVELAGPAAEDAIVSQFLDRTNRSEAYLKFLDQYRRRFQQEPGFAGLAGYDAAKVALEALEIRGADQSLKQAIIAQKNFQGVQQRLTINRFGDADRNSFIARVHNGQYLPVE
ncbi:MAG: amino acid ABC transporter substrate-binding protein [Deltaproteobacteria bacterium]|nr:amino acid ABC transporter substrate-binding protein [Deltaproteobacteria bacterium]NCP04020.1 amino acid ABC transporter substrate-binding protein [Deltaproteobacteria bacterium]